MNRTILGEFFIVVIPMGGEAMPCIGTAISPHRFPANRHNPATAAYPLIINPLPAPIVVRCNTSYYSQGSLQFTITEA